MFKWIVGNWEYIVSVFCGIVAVASIIVKITPTTKDDSVLGKILKILDHFSIVKTANDKKLIEIAKENIKEGE